MSLHSSPLWKLELNSWRNCGKQYNTPASQFSHRKPGYLCLDYYHLCMFSQQRLGVGSLRSRRRVEDSSSTIYLGADREKSSKRAVMWNSRRRACTRCVNSWQSWPASGTGESGWQVPNPTDTEVKSPQMKFVQSTYTIVLRQGRKKLGKNPDKWDEEVETDFTGQWALSSEPSPLHLTHLPWSQKSTTGTCYYHIIPRWG